MKHQVITFTMMIFFTLISFAAVWLDFSEWFIKPIIILLAVVQVIFQLYYFMHMQHKGSWNGYFVFIFGFTSRTTYGLNFSHDCLALSTSRKSAINYSRFSIFHILLEK